MKELGSINNSAVIQPAYAGHSVTVESAVFQQMVTQIIAETAIDVEVTSDQSSAGGNNQPLGEKLPSTENECRTIADLNQPIPEETLDQINTDTVTGIMEGSIEESKQGQSVPDTPLMDTVGAPTLSHFLQVPSNITVETITKAPDKDTPQLNPMQQSMVLNGKPMTLASENTAVERIVTQMMPLYPPYQTEADSGNISEGGKISTMRDSDHITGFLPIANQHVGAMVFTEQEKEDLAFDISDQSSGKEASLLSQGQAIAILIPAVVGEPEGNKVATKSRLAPSEEKTSDQTTLSVREHPSISSMGANEGQSPSPKSRSTTFVTQQSVDKHSQQVDIGATNLAAPNISANKELIAVQLGEDHRLANTVAPPQDAEAAVSIVNARAPLSDSQGNTKDSAKESNSLSSTAVSQSTVMGQMHLRNIDHAPMVSVAAAQHPKQASDGVPFEKMIQQLTDPGSQQGKTITLQLVPEKLGAMQMTFVQHAEGSRLEFAFEQPQTKELVLSIKQELEQVMHRQGQDTLSVREVSSLSTERLQQQTQSFVSNSFSGGGNQQQRFMQQQHTKQKTEHYGRKEEESLPEQILHEISILV